MGTREHDEPDELDFEEQRAGIEPRHSDVFENLEASSWLAGLDDIGGQQGDLEQTSDALADVDPDAERAAEHQLHAEHPPVRFNPQDLHQHHTE